MKRILWFSVLSPGISLLLVISGCNKEDIAKLPSLITKNIILITDSTAISGGEITDDGGAPVTARGICWSISQSPTLSDFNTIDSMGIGNFTSWMNGLSCDINYYVRSYATNSIGTAYGNEITFAIWSGMPDPW